MREEPKKNNQITKKCESARYYNETIKLQKNLREREILTKQSNNGEI